MLILLLLPVLVGSCKAISTLIHDDQVVASVGERKLYKSEIERVIPNMIPAEDSARLAAQYINSWAMDLLYLQVAEEQLSKAELDVSEDLENFRRSLLKYRYEQRYINERLDTLITDAEVRNYYEAHADRFTLDRPVLKARYMVIPADSRSFRTIKELMGSDDAMDAIAADSLAFTAALRYVDSSDSWLDALLLARELGTDEESMMKSLKNKFIEFKGDDGNIRVAYVVDLVRKGEPAPLEYCADRIRDIILSARKHELVSGLERELLIDAQNKDKFVIY